MFKKPDPVWPRRGREECEAEDVKRLDGEAEAEGENGRKREKRALSLSLSLSAFTCLCLASSFLPPLALYGFDGRRRRE